MKILKLILRESIWNSSDIWTGKGLVFQPFLFRKDIENLADKMGIIARCF